MTYISTQQNLLLSFPATAKTKSPWAVFLQWAADEDEFNHIGWVGGAITGMCAFFFPLTMAVILFNGAHFGLIIVAMISLTSVVVTNLAALPTKYTIPCFGFGILLDLFVILFSFLIK